MSITIRSILEWLVGLWEGLSPDRHVIDENPAPTEGGAMAYEIIFCNRVGAPTPRYYILREFPKCPLCGYRVRLPDA